MNPTPAAGDRPKERGKAWTVQDVATFLSIPVSTLYEWRRTGYGPPARKVGKYLRYRPDEVVSWFDGLAATS